MIPKLKRIKLQTIKVKQKTMHTSHRAQTLLLTKIHEKYKKQQKRLRGKTQVIISSATLSEKNKKEKFLKLLLWRLK